jgi:3-oxoacyl-[acyl-carrier protein] reductase
MTLRDKIAIVTGAGQGIGKAIALRLTKERAIPIIVDIDETASEKVVKEIKELGVETSSIQLDVSNVESLKRMVKTIWQEYKTIDILVNNAGILHVTAIEDITENEWDRMMAVNLKSVFFASQQVLPYMKKKKWGRIINIASVAGRMG